jgi:aspartate/methionine/tyrosine aminotransferase
LIRDRDMRRLEHSKQANEPLADAVPTVGDLAEGEGRYVMVNGRPELHKRVKGKVYRWPGLPSTDGPAIVATNGTSQRAYDASSTSIDELADVVYTLMLDLRTRGLIP